MKQYLCYQIVLVISLCSAPVGQAQAVNQNRIQKLQTGQREPGGASNSFRKMPAGAPGNRPELQVQIGHSGGINAVAFTPDDRYIVTAGNDNFALLWDVETGAEIHRFVGHTYMVQAVAVSPRSGRFIVTGSIDNTARLWNLETGKELLVFKEHTSTVYSVAFSPDESLILTGSADDTVRLWERETGKTRRVFPHPNTVTAAVFTADGQQMLTACGDGNLRLWDLSAPGEPRLFAGKPGDTDTVALSPDGRILAAGGKDGVVRLWDARTGGSLGELQGHTASVNSVAFSPDGNRLVTAAWDGTARVWAVGSGKQLSALRHMEGGDAILVVAAFSRDGRRVLSGGRDNTACLWDVDSGQRLRRFQGNAFAANNSAISPDGRWLAVDILYGYAALWDLTTGRQVRYIGKEVGEGLRISAHIAFTPDSQYLAIGVGTVVRLWDVNTGQPAREFQTNHTEQINAIAFSPDGRFFVTGSRDKTARIWSRQTGEEMTAPLKQNYPVHAVAVSPDNHLVLTGNGDESVTAMYSTKVDQEPPCEAILWDATNGAYLRKFYHDFTFYSHKPIFADEKDPLHTRASPAMDVIRGKVAAVAFSPDGSLVVTGNDNGIAHLWKVGTGEEVQHFPGTLYIKSLALAPDNKKLMMACFSDETFIFDVATGDPIYALPHSTFVLGAQLTPDGDFVITQSWDNTSRVWSVKTGKEVCRLVALYHGDWVVVTPEGRFDTNDLEEVRGLHWLMPDDPLKPLGIEIFMRDYYEPRLLSRLLEGETFDNTIKDVSKLNRAQPTVQMKVEPSSEAPDLVNVTIAVSRAEHALPNGTRMQTDVYDLRLFRDGKLIAYEPKLPEPAPASRSRVGTSEGLTEWRQRTAVKLGVDGHAVITFPGVRLPHDGGGQVKFSAYAFNEDRVKSATDFKYYKVAAPLAPVKRRAYVISMGVNAYESAAKDLTYAAKDARHINEIVSETLQNTGDYGEIIRVSLLSDRQGSRLTEKTATRANLHAVLRLLAGKPIAPEVFQAVPDATKLKDHPPRPEDLIILSFSGHGEVDKRGNFYLLPYDIGRGHGEEVTDRLLANGISSVELSEWMKDIDAGEMVLIVDACHSAAAVQAEGFKPGPMGSRGLGQLAFDKRMKILAATQPDQEVKEKGGSRLMKALITDGLEARKADDDPPDGKITIREWLQYAVRRVPEIYVAPSAAREPQGWKSNTFKSEKPQMPALFDFSRREREIILLLKK